MKLERYSKKLFSVIVKKGFWLRPLGELERGKYIWLVSKRNHHGNKPNLLIVAGFHGEEPAGPWAILKWIEICNLKTLSEINLSFLPVVNPTGFDVGQRKNKWNEKTNQGFCHPEKNESLSREGKILLENSETLCEFARDGCLSLHEDVTTTKYYIYDHSASAGDFGRLIRDEEDKYFDRLEDGTNVAEENEPEAFVKDGLITGLHDGSFDDFLYHKGIPHVFATETPGKFPLHQRIKAGVRLIDKFIELSLHEYKK